MEKKQITIRLTTLIIVLAIIVIICMGVYIYIIKNNTNDEINELKMQINNIENTELSIKSEDTETINSIENTEIANNIENTKVTNEINNTELLNEQLVLDFGKEMYERAFHFYWFIATDYHNEYYFDDGTYSEILNIDEIHDTLAKNALENLYSEKGIIEKNNKYYILLADRGSDVSYVKNELTLKNIQENKIEFISTEIYSDDEKVYDAINPETLDITKLSNVTKKDNKFVMEKIDNKWKVTEFTLPN